MNKAILIGNLGKAPEVRPLKDDKKVASFFLAVTEGYGDKQITTWFKCEVWNKLAEIAEKFLTKGSQVCVDGSFRLETWEDKEGNKREAFKVVVHEMKLLGGKSDKPQDAAPVQAETAAETNDGDGSGLPF